MEARREVDWVAKLAVLEGYRERDSLGWGDPRLKAVDLQWSDVRADRGLAHRLVATGRLEVLVDEADVQRRRRPRRPPTPGPGSGALPAPLRRTTSSLPRGTR